MRWLVFSLLLFLCACDSASPSDPLVGKYMLAHYESVYWSRADLLCHTYSSTSGKAYFLTLKADGAFTRDLAGVESISSATHNGVYTVEDDTLWLNTTQIMNHGEVATSNGPLPREPWRIDGTYLHYLRKIDDYPCPDHYLEITLNKYDIE